MHKYGGAPTLGSKGLVVKSHGNSKAGVIRNSIFQCVTFKEQQINEKIKTGIVEKTKETLSDKEE